MNTPSKSINAWIVLQEDMLTSASYKNLLEYKVFNSVDMLSLCWVGTQPASANADAPYTLYTKFTVIMEQIVTDAKRINPNIKVLVMLGYNNPDWLSQIFTNNGATPSAQAALFADNVVGYLKQHNLDGFDIDWEPSLSGGPPPPPPAPSPYISQIESVLTALRAAFDAEQKQNRKMYYLTISPSTTENLNGPNLNATMDFLTTQNYGGASKSKFINIHVHADIIAYGSKFEAYYQSAQDVYSQMQAGACSITTQWRLNSDNYQYEQAQQMILFQLAYDISGNVFADAAVIGVAGNPAITNMVIRSGNVLDAIQATNTDAQGNTYTLLQHGGNGGAELAIQVPDGDKITEITGYTGMWYGWNVVLQITIKTEKGVNLGTFGSMEGATSQTAFTYRAPTGKSIVAFSGATVHVPEAGGGESFVVRSLNVTYA